jgi:hypothetical protein
VPYVARSKDNPLEKGRAADQNQSCDNDGFFYSEIHYISLEIAAPDTQCSTGDSKRIQPLPSGLDGMNLVFVSVYHPTPGAGGSPTLVQIRNVTDAVDVLSTRAMVDVGENDSKDATTAYVINAANDDVDTNDVWAIDVDQLPTTVPFGGVVTLGFRRV